MTVVVILVVILAMAMATLLRCDVSLLHVRHEVMAAARQVGKRSAKGTSSVDVLLLRTATR